MNGILKFEYYMKCLIATENYDQEIDQSFFFWIQIKFLS